MPPPDAPAYLTAPRPPITGMADILEIEKVAVEVAVPLRNTHEIFLRAAQLFGNQTAITQLHDGDAQECPRTVSYTALLGGIHQAANLFRSLGVGDDDAVALLLPSMVEAHFALWGAQLAGRVCPINYMLDVNHIAELMTAAGVKVLVALGPDPDFDICEKAQRLSTHMPGVKLLLVGTNDPAHQAASFEHLLAQQPTDLAFARDIGPDTIAACYHTGGTTGAPKLAIHTHGNEIHTSWFAGLFYALEATDAMINGFPLFHVAGAFVYGSACFCAGASVLLPPKLGMRHKRFVSNYWKIAERYKITHLATVPTVMSSLLEVPRENSDLSSIRALYTGGSPLPTELANVFEQRFGIAVRNILGMTESAGLVTIEPLAAPRQPLSCGFRLPFTDLFATPPNQVALDVSMRCAAHQPGIVVLKGPSVSPGYTDARRNGGMFSPDGHLISGDLGHLDEEGRLFLTGRAKDVIIRGAHNIDPSMIEEAFAQHPDVHACAAVGEPDPYAGELPAVFLTLRGGSTATAQEILEFVTPLIHERAAVPKRVTVMDTIPTTAVGKIYKPRLRLNAIENAFTDALKAFDSKCRRIEVQGMEVPGGLSAQVSIWTSAHEPGLFDEVNHTLGQFTVPFELIWHQST